MSIVLIGYRGSGKTTIGKRLADQLWQPFVDTDDLVVRKAGGRVLIVHEAVRSGGFGAEVAIRLAELLGDATSMTLRRLTTPDVRIPAAPQLQAALIPNANAIAASAREMVAKAK